MLRTFWNVHFNCVMQTCLYLEIRSTLSGWCGAVLCQVFSCDSRRESKQSRRMMLTPVSKTKPRIQLAVCIMFATLQLPGCHDSFAAEPGLSFFKCQWRPLGFPCCHSAQLRQHDGRNLSTIVMPAYANYDFGNMTHTVHDLQLICIFYDHIIMTIWTDCKLGDCSTARAQCI